jgi:phosphonatase-like hydrolase
LPPWWRGDGAPGDPQNEARANAIYAGFQLSLERAYSGDGVKPIAGVHAAIGWLREQGVAVAANTGFSRRITDLVLSRAGLDGLFHTVVADDDVPKGRPAPFMIFHAMESTGVTDVRSVISIGDTPLDLQAGCNSGVAGVVGVATGAYSSDELRKHPHTHIIPSVAALPHLVESAAGIPRIIPRNGGQL